LENALKVQANKIVIWVSITAFDRTITSGVEDFLTFQMTLTLPQSKANMALSIFSAK